MSQPQKKKFCQGQRITILKGLLVLYFPANLRHHPIVRLSVSSMTKVSQELMLRFGRKLKFSSFLGDFRSRKWKIGPISLSNGLGDFSFTFHFLGIFSAYNIAKSYLVGIARRGVRVIYDILLLKKWSKVNNFDNKNIVKFQH